MLWLMNLGFAAGGEAEPVGGGISKRKKDQGYKKAWNAAKWRKDQRKAIELAVQKERKEKPKLTLKKSVKIELSKPEVEQIASINDTINRELAIEYELQRLEEFKRKEKENLAILLLM